jgi:hypothetical protein
MDDNQTRHLNAAVTGLALMDETDNQTIWNPQPAVVTKKTAVETEIQKIKDIDDGITDKSGIATAKQTAKEKAAKTAEKVSKALVSYYRDQNDDESREEVDYPWFELRFAKDQDAIDRWTLIKNKCTPPIVTALDTGGYGVNALLVTRLGNEINDFVAIWGRPKDARAAIKAKNAALDAEFKLLDKAVGTLVESLFQFEETNKEFYDACVAAFAVDDSGVRHKAIEIVYEDEETGIRLTNVEAAIKKLSSPVGVVTVMKQEIENGNFTLLSKKNNYEISTTNSVPVQTGKLTRLTIKLKRIVV